MNFFFDSSYNPDAAWYQIINDEPHYDIPTPDIDEKKREYASVDFNTELAYMGLWWKDAEPRDNEWQDFVGVFATSWMEEGWVEPREDPFIPGDKNVSCKLGT